MVKNHPPFITRLTLKQFRSIKGATVEFEPLTLFAGKNGSGKSNIVDAFKFLTDILTVQLGGAFEIRGGIRAVRYRNPKGYPGNLGMGIEMQLLKGGKAKYAFEAKALPDYRFEIVHEECSVEIGTEASWFRRDSKFDSNVKGLETPALAGEILALPLVGGAKPFLPCLEALRKMRVHQIDPFKIQEMQDPDPGTVLKSDGSNAASVLLEIKRKSPEQFDNLCKFLKKIVPCTEKVESISHGKKLSLKFTQAWGSDSERKTIGFEAFAMSDGTLRALGLLAAIFQQPPPSLLVIEEPEATIHPGALGPLMDAIKLSADSGTQIVLTSHSPEILDQEGVAPENIRIVQWERGETKVGALGEGAMENLKKDLMGIGEMMRMNALDYHPSFTPPAPLFGH